MTDTENTRVRFVALTVSLWALALLVTAVLTPPDPLTQLQWLVPLLVVSTGVAYWFVHHHESSPRSLLQRIRGR